MKRALLVVAGIAAGVATSLALGCGPDCGPDLLPFDPGTYVPVDSTEAPSGYQLVLNSDRTLVETYATSDGHHYEIHYSGGAPF